MNKQRDAQWCRIRARARSELGESIYLSVIERLSIIEEGDEYIAFHAPTSFMKRWITEYYQDRLLTLWQTEDIDIKKINILTNDTNNYLSNVNNIQEQTKQLSFSFNPIANPRMTFDTFIKSPENALAYEACQRLIGDQKRLINPLFLYGSVGSGKTHLLHAVYQVNNRGILMSAERFMFHFVQALRQSQAFDFKTTIRRTPMLIIDDIQFLVGKQNTQEEFFHTIENLLLEGSQIVVACDRLPYALDIPKRIQERLACGLVAAIEPPSEKLRFRILQEKEIKDPTPLNNDILHILANNIHAMRTLEGAYNRLRIHQQLANTPITPEKAIQLLQDLTPKPVLSVQNIQDVVANYYGLTRQDIMASRRTKSIAEARQIAMYLTKLLTTISLVDIGRQFGGRDHATVIYAIKKIEERKKNSQFEQIVQTLTQQLQTSCFS